MDWVQNQPRYVKASQVLQSGEISCLVDNADVAINSLFLPEARMERRSARAHSQPSYAEAPLSEPAPKRRRVARKENEHEADKDDVEEEESPAPLQQSVSTQASKSCSSSTENLLARTSTKYPKWKLLTQCENERVHVRTQGSFEELFLHLRDMQRKTEEVLMAQRQIIVTRMQTPTRADVRSNSNDHEVLPNQRCSQ